MNTSTSDIGCKPTIDLTSIPEDILSRIVVKDSKWNIISNPPQKVIELIKTTWEKVKKLIINFSRQDPHTWEISGPWNINVWEIIAIDKSTIDEVYEKIRIEVNPTRH